MSAILLPSKRSKEDEERRLKGLTGLALDAAVERKERRERARDEAIKEVRFLKAFNNEQRGYIAYKSNDFASALRAYKFVILSNESTDTRMISLVNRIDGMRACISLQGGDVATAEALRNKVLLKGEELLQDHPSARRQEDRNRRLANKELTLNQQLDCENPELIVFPLRPVSMEKD